MSIFASHTQKTLPLAMDVPHTVTIQKVSGKDLEAVQFAHLLGVQTGRGRNWATKFMQLAGSGQATEADAKKVLDDPLSGFDRIALVKAGLKAWTYTDAAGAPKSITDAAMADLDDEALEFIATEILRLTKPALFQTREEAQVAQKNG